MKHKVIGNAKIFLKRNSATILTCMGTVGVVTTAVLAAKETPKALALLEEAKKEKGENLTKLETVKTVAPAYIPAALSGLATITCIVGANVLNKRQQAGLISAYALLDNSYKEYKQKVEDLYGKEVDEHIQKEIAKDKYEDADISVEDGKQLFYDEFSERYFEADPLKVSQAEYRLNQNLFKRGYAYLNEFYEDIGIDPIDGGWELGWSPGLNSMTAWQDWADFNHHKVVMDDGLECIIVSFYIQPDVDFMNYV